MPQLTEVDVRRMESNIRRRTLRGRRSSRRGGVLVVALLTVISISVMGAGFLHITSSIMRRQEASIDSKHAFYLAEAGLAESWAGVLLGKTGTVGSEALPAKLGHGMFWVETTDNPDGTRTLESTALCGSGRATLEVVIGWPDSIANENAIMVDEPLIIPEGSLIDAYEPPAAGGGGAGGIGPSGAEPEGGEAPTPATRVKVQSNGSITVLGSPASPSTILGDLAPGPGQAATVNPDSTLSGGIFPAPEPFTMPSVDVPNVTIGAGVDQNSPTPYAVPTGLSGYQHLKVAANSQAIITGPATVVIGELEVDPLGELVLDATAGEIEIFVTSKMLVKRGASISTIEDDSTQLSVQIDGDVPVQLAGQSEFHGMLLAPQAQVQVSSPFQLFGSIVARRLDLAPGVQLHFDQRVWSEAKNRAMPYFIGWRVDSLPQGVRSGVGTDPFSSKGLTLNDLPMPYQAHEDQNISVTYIDLALAPQTYDGLESAFDWNQVSTVTSISRDGTQTVRKVVHDDSASSRDGLFRAEP